MTKKKFKDIPRLPEQELRDLARQIVTNEVFITNSKEGLDFAFGTVLALGGAELLVEAAEQVGALWEEYSKAGPRSINGYPSFFSYHVVHRDDLSALGQTIAEFKAALGETSQMDRKAKEEDR